METAYDWGLKRNSCKEALRAREALGPKATQKDWYEKCPRGDWLLWQFQHLPRSKYEELRPAIRRAGEKAVARAIRRGLRSLKGVDAPWATTWRKWAREWLNGKNRVAEDARLMADLAEGRLAVTTAPYWAARAASYLSNAETYHAGSVAANTVARTSKDPQGVRAEQVELKKQAIEIREEIPKWPGK